MNNTKLRIENMRSEITNIKPIIFAHRGASGIAVENSITAFQKAIDCGADGLEPTHG